MSVSRRKKAAREAALKLKSAELKREKLFAGVTKKHEFKEYKPAKKYYRETQEYSSFESNSQTQGTAKERNEYSGDYITGLATMHKSNIVPVGKGDDAESYAKMRR